MSSPPVVSEVANEESFLRSKNARGALSESSEELPRSRLKEVEPGGADAGRGGNDRLVLGLDLKVFRGGESRAES